MKKSLVVLLIASAFSMTVDALELHHGRLVNHKEWATGGVSYSFQSTTKLPMDNTALVATAALPRFGTTSGLSPVACQSSAQITNNATVTKSYNYFNQCCVVISGSNAACAYYSDSFQLEPGGSAAENIQPTLSYQFTSPGTYSTFTGANIFDGTSNFISNSYGQEKIS